MSVDFDYSLLVRDGICKLNDAASPETIARWNRALDPIFRELGDRERTEIGVTRLRSLGIFDEFFDKKMRTLIPSLLPDAVLFDFHVYEIPASQSQSHISSERMRGWHPDVRPLPGMDMRMPHYLSLFVYLSEVGEEDGAFEILPLCSQEYIASGMPSIKVLGPKGTTFVWNKAYHHRASPNLGRVKRRLLKVSFQHNYLENGNLLKPQFQEIRAELEGKDEFLEYLLGKYHHGSHHGAHFLPRESGPITRAFPVFANARVQRLALADQVRLRMKRFLGVPI